MSVKNTIKIIMIDKSIKPAQMAAGLGINYQSWTTKLSRGTFRFSEVEKIAGLLGCDIVFKDRKTGKIYE